ncbi:hypothetical protein [Neptuniibacter sp. QD37_11]|uniref:hypothetical protein n=1 Tax=Neptuniibacter sp. QD37_11 TaxID=3398209 RepID=UPI0039F58F7C
MKKLLTISLLSCLTMSIASANKSDSPQLVGGFQTRIPYLSEYTKDALGMISYTIDTYTVTNGAIYKIGNQCHVLNRKLANEDTYGPALIPNYVDTSETTQCPTQTESGSYIDNKGSCYIMEVSQEELNIPTFKLGDELQHIKHPTYTIGEKQVEC